MLYYFFQVLNDLDFSGAGLFQYLSFRAAVACIVSLIIVWGWGGKFIQILRRRQVKDKVRDLALEGQETKGKTPTMGGILILLGIIVPVLLFCNLSNIYVLMMLFVTICLGLLGFLDDYIKVIKKS